MPPRVWFPGSIRSAQQQPKQKHLTDVIRRHEALSLYREILRTCKHFHWTDVNTGQPWNKVLKDQAKRDFRDSQQETDPLIVARMLVAGRDGLQQIQNRFNAATTAAWKRIDKDTAKSSTSSSTAPTATDAVYTMESRFSGSGK